MAACRLFIVALGLLCSCGRQSPERIGSVGAAHRLISCGAWAQLPHGMWDLSSLTRDRTHVPCIGRWILNHWTTREVPYICFSYCEFSLSYRFFF